MQNPCILPLNESLYMKNEYLFTSTFVVQKLVVRNEKKEKT